MGAGRAGEVGPVRLPPWPRRDLVLGRRYVEGVMQPAVPASRHAAGFGEAVVDHPSPLAPQRRIGLPAPGAVVAIADLVRADELAIERSPQQRAERRSVPPRKK